MAKLQITIKACASKPCAYIHKYLSTYHLQPTIVIAITEHVAFGKFCSAQLMWCGRGCGYMVEQLKHLIH